MSIVQRTKLQGLKKLRLISKYTKGIACASPFKVYSSSDQFRLKHAMGNPRLLIRTDEKGKVYRDLYWEKMPRTEIVGSTLNEDEVQRVLGDVSQSHSRMWMLVHPTKPRTEIAYTGVINLTKGTRPYLKIVQNPASDQKNHRLLLGNLIYLNFVEAHSLGPLRKKNSGHFEINVANIQRFDPEMRKVTENAVHFLNQGIRTGHIKIGRHDTEMSFLSWKDQPSLLEFFDLIENREIPESKKQKTRNAIG